MIKRLPIIRHVRWLILTWKVERHYAMLGSPPVHRHHDNAVLDAIWRALGKKKGPRFEGL